MDIDRSRSTMIITRSKTKSLLILQFLYSKNARKLRQKYKYRCIKKSSRSRPH